MQTTYDVDKRKLLSGLAHGSIFLGSLVVPVAIPIVILLISDDPVVKANAREAINFTLNVWLYGIIMGVLCFFLIGFLFLPIWFLYHWILPIFAIVKCLKDPDEVFHYPFIFRVV